LLLILDEDVPKMKFVGNGVTMTKGTGVVEF